MKDTRQRRSVANDSNRSLPKDATPLLHQWLDSLGPDFRSSYLRSQCFSKFVSDDTAPAAVRRQRAINKWLATERNNEATNDRLATISEEYNVLPRVTYRVFMDRVRSVVLDVLGEVPPNDLILGSFSGGATTSRRRTEGHPSLKYLGKAHITARAKLWLDDLVVDSPLWNLYDGFSQIEVIPGNVLFTVPKTTDIDRCCAKEPDLNMYMQKGIGDFIRRRLRYAGVDLNDQSRNRELARVGSITGALATLDLSSASDSISSRLVEESLPFLWFGLLSDLRSPRTLIDGVWHENEMFSSMGNGFTFELESLLFYAIARATAWSMGISGVISVYGDDIVCPSPIAANLAFVLKLLGFDTNTDKSFWTGPFRESCGGHFANGLDVTPFYVKAPVTRLVDLIHVCNSIRKWARLDGLTILDPEVFDFWSSLASMVPDVFWGGYDFADKTRLVSPPRGDRQRRLSPVTIDLETDIGGYLHWHNSASNRNGPPSDVLDFTIRKVTLEKYRTRPVRWLQRTTHLFPQEVMCQDVSEGLTALTG